MAEREQDELRGAARHSSRFRHLRGRSWRIREIRHPRLGRVALPQVQFWRFFWRSINSPETIGHVIFSNEKVAHRWIASLDGNVVQ